MKIGNLEAAIRMVDGQMDATYNLTGKTSVNECVSQLVANQYCMLYALKVLLQNSLDSKILYFKDRGIQMSKTKPKDKPNVHAPTK